MVVDAFLWSLFYLMLVSSMHFCRWSCMAKLMKNRTDNDIKNKWYSMMRKEKKALEKLQRAGHHLLPAQANINNTADVELAAQGLLQYQDGAIYDNAPYAEEIAAEAEVRASDQLYLLSASATYDWSLNNPYAQNLSSFFNPELVVIADGSLNVPIPSARASGTFGFNSIANATVAGHGRATTSATPIACHSTPNSGAKSSEQEIAAPLEGRDISSTANDGRNAKATPIDCPSTPHVAEKENDESETHSAV